MCQNVDLDRASSEFQQSATLVGQVERVGVRIRQPGQIHLT